MFQENTPSGARLDATVANEPRSSGTTRSGPAAGYTTMPVSASDRNPVPYDSTFAQGRSRSVAGPPSDAQPTWSGVHQATVDPDTSSDRTGLGAVHTVLRDPSAWCRTTFGPHAATTSSPCQCAAIRLPSPSKESRRAGATASAIAATVRTAPSNVRSPDRLSRRRSAW